MSPRKEPTPTIDEEIRQRKALEGKILKLVQDHERQFKQPITTIRVDHDEKDCAINVRSYPKKIDPWKVGRG